MSKKLPIQSVVVVMSLAIAFGNLTLRVANAQGRNRIIQKLTAPGVSEPVGLSNLKVGGQEITFDKEFLSDADWIGTITFDVVNTTNKGITHFEVDGFVATPDSSAEGIVVPLGRFGGNTGMGGIQATALLGGGEVAHCTAASRYDQFRQTFGSRVIDCYRLSLFVSNVMFSDDSRWSRGTLLRRDPTNPNKWIRPSVQQGFSQHHSDRLKPVSCSSSHLASGNRSGSAQGGCGELDIEDYFPCSGGFLCAQLMPFITPWADPIWRLGPVYVACEDPAGVGCDISHGWALFLCGPWG